MILKLTTNISVGETPTDRIIAFQINITTAYLSLLYITIFPHPFRNP
jgi:hypothetical protein